VQKALILGLTPSIRANMTSITSEGLIFFDAIIRANCRAGIFHSSGILTPLSFLHPLNIRAPQSKDPGRVLPQDHSLLFFGKVEV